MHERIIVGNDRPPHSKSYNNARMGGAASLKLSVVTSSDLSFRPRTDSNVFIFRLK